MGLRTLGFVAFSTLSNDLRKRRREGMLFKHEADVEPKVAIIGIGGAGCNVLSDIYWNLSSADTIAINTDRVALENTDADSKIFICKAVTQGNGTGGDSMLGKKCAQAHIEEIENEISGHDVVFIVAGMGGGTGSGAAPIVAEIAQRLNCVVFSILINPFGFETARLRTAREGIAHVRSVCPMTIVVENDLVLKAMPDMTAEDAFKAVNDSVIAFIKKQQSKVMTSFMQQLGHIGDFVKDDGVIPKTGSTKGLVIN